MASAVEEEVEEATDVERVLCRFALLAMPLRSEEGFLVKVEAEWIGSDRD